MKQFNRFSAPLAIIALAHFATPATAQNTDTDSQTKVRVQQIFETLYADKCRSLMENQNQKPSQPEIYQLTFNYEGENSPPRGFQLFEYSCFEGPYNWGFVYFGADDYQEIFHMSFAVPTFEVSYENDNSDEAVSNIEVTGFSAVDQLFVTRFSPKTGTLNSFNRWRGPADAFSSGQWKFIEGQFVLQTYDVDASFDGVRQAIRIYGPGQPPSSD